MTELRIETVNINSLTPDPANARKHDGKNLKAIASSLEKFGQRKPIVVTPDSIVVAGNGTVEAAKSLGWTEIAVARTPVGWTWDQIKAFALADNRTAELAEWDDKVLADQLLELDANGWELEELGFENLEPPITDQDDEPLSFDDAPARAKLGDVWLLGKHRLMCGDSTDENTIKRLINDNQIDGVFTDPPYGINEKGDRSNRNGITAGNNFKDFIDDSIIYAEKAFDQVQKLNVPVQVWFGANYYAHHLPQSNNWLVWDKRVEDKQRDMQSDCELAWIKSRYNSVRIFRHLWKGLIKGSEHGEKRVHPTQKPVALSTWCFEEYNFGNKVLDLFGGSGSTLIACEKTNRQAFVMELDTTYVDVIIKRWEDLTGKTAELIEE